MHLDNVPVEVFVLILSIFDSKDLLHCALVCKRWSELALEVKWKECVVDLADLVQGLGPAPLNASDEEMEKAVASPGWLRVNRLRKMITKLKVSRSPPTHITYLQRLQRAVEPPDQPFCPNLRAIELTRTLSQPDTYDFLVGHSLQDFTLGFQSTSGQHLRTVVTNTLQRFSVRSPRVENIDAYSSNTVFDFGVFSRLRVLNYGGNLSVTSWNQLCAGCPLLERAHIWRPRRRMQPVEETGPSDPQTPTLPVLQSLEIDSIKLAILITYIVTRTHMPALVELAVNLVNITKVEGEALLSLLQDRNPSMKKLQLTGDALNLTTRGFFTQLRDLELCAPIDTYTSECLERIIKSNPQMTRLVTYNTTQPRTRPTLNTSFLETVAQACVDMLEIRVPLDTLDFPWAAEEKTPPAQLERLKDLVLDPLHIQPDAMAPFARYLTRLCPVLETFETTTLHPGLGPGIPTPEAPTQEEVDNSKLMENLVYEAQVDNSE